MPGSFSLDLLQKEFAQRRIRNPAYSLRAFARDLQVSLTALSEAIAGKRSLSRRNLQKIQAALHLSPLDAVKLFEKTNKIEKKEVERLLLREEEFRLIAEWWHLAILNLAKLRENRSRADWVAKRLGITKTDAAKAIARLNSLGLLEVKGGRLVRTAAPISTSRDVPSGAIKRSHRDHLYLAEKSLINDSVEKREFSAVVMAMNPEEIKGIKDYLMKTKRKVSEMAEKGEPSEVYVLSFQLFPLTKS